jgi:hypothetical protein
LLNRLDALISELSDRAATLAAEEEVKRQGCVQRALLIADSTEAGLWDRYSKDADRALFRALEEYRAEQAWEAARAAEAAAEEPEEPNDVESEVVDESPPVAEADPEIGVPGTDAPSEPVVAAEPVVSLSEKAREMLKDVPPGLLREPVAQALRETSRNEPGAPADMPVIPCDLGTYTAIHGVASDPYAGRWDPAYAKWVAKHLGPPPKQSSSG